MVTINEEQLVLVPTVDGVKRTKVVGVTEKIVAFADDAGGMILVNRPLTLGKVTVGQLFNFTAAGVGTLHAEPKPTAPLRTGRQGCSVKKEYC